MAKTPKTPRRATVAKKQPVASEQQPAPKKIGRPSLYDDERHPRRAYRLALLYNMDNEAIAESLGIPIGTLNRWISQHRRFRNAIKRGREGTDKRVVRSLYERAVGYSHKAEKIFYNSRTGMVERVEYIEHYPPSERAIEMWLHNRQRGRWKSYQPTAPDAGGTSADALAKGVRQSAREIEALDDLGEDVDE